MPRIVPARATPEALDRHDLATRARAPRRSALTALVALAAAPLLLGSCAQILGIDELAGDAGPTYRVRGTATGVIDPLSLWLEHARGHEILTVVRDGPFQFTTQLPEGEAYGVRFVQNPPCVLTNASGDAGVSPDVELACGPVLLESLSVSGVEVPAIDFTPGRTRYDVRVSVAQQHVQITAAAASAEASVTVAGQPVTSGEPTAPLALTLGDTYIDVVVTAGTSERTYQVVVHRAEPVEEHSTLKMIYASPGDQAGYSLGLSSGRMAIGVPYEDAAAPVQSGDPGDGATDSGAVLVGRAANDSWAVDTFLKASNVGVDDNFGHSVEIDGDVLVVGAPYEDGSARGVNGASDEAATDSGAAYVFRHDGTAWAQEAYLKASNTGAGDNFGWSVTVSGDTVVVGARGEDGGGRGINADPEDDSVGDAGAAYVFRHAGGVWVQEAYLKASNTGREDNFGRHLTMDGDTLAISARFEDSSSRGVNGDQENDQAVNSGAVYVFRRSGTIWDQEAYLKASNSAFEDNFGLSMALLGDTLAVSAPEEDSGATGVDGNQENDSAAGSGAVYVFGRTGATWAQQAYLKASNTGAGDNFGWSLDLAGDMLAVSAIGEDSAATGADGNQNDNTASDSGAAYLFHRQGDAWKQAAYAKASNTGAGDWFGYAVALSEGRLLVTAIHEDSKNPGVIDDDTTSDSGAIYELR
jgi:hypothetical protein